MCCIMFLFLELRHHGNENLSCFSLMLTYSIRVVLKKKEGSMRPVTSFDVLMKRIEQTRIKCRRNRCHVVAALP